MSELELFARQYSLSEADGLYYGVCEDMFVNLRGAEGEIVLSLYLDLPKSNSKRTALIDELRQKAARYESARVDFCACDTRMLNMSLNDTEGAAKRLTLWLLECDTLLRAFGRELGVLCSRCRSEIKEDMKYSHNDGIVLPVCALCDASGAEGAPTTARRPANRVYDMRQRRKRGVLGALAGLLAAALFWAVIVYLGFGSTFVPAIAVAFIVNLGYVRLGGSVDSKRFIIVCAFTVLAIIAGEFLGELTRAVSDYSQYIEDISQIGYEEIVGEETYNYLLNMSRGEYISQYVFGKPAITAMISDIVVSALFGALGAYIVTGKRGRRR